MSFRLILTPFTGLACCITFFLGAGSVGKENFQEIQLFKPQPGKKVRSEFQGLHAWILQATTAASG